MITDQSTSSFINPEEAVEGKAAQNKEENQKTIQALKIALQSEHSVQQANSVVGEVIGWFSLQRDIT